MRLIDRLGRLPLVIVFGWAVAAALAVSVGVVGIGLVGSGLFGGGTEPLNEAEVARDLAAEESSAGGSPAPSETSADGSPAPSETPGTAQSPQTSPSPAGESASVHTRGGTVIADCRRIISMSPAQGWAVHEQDDDEGEFRSVRDNHQRVKIDLAGCTAGLPRLEVAVESNDD